jgi:HEAT repeats
MHVLLQHTSIALLLISALCASGALGATAPSRERAGKDENQPPPTMKELPALLKQLTSEKLGEDREARERIVLLLKGEDSGKALRALAVTLAMRDTKRPLKTSIIRCLGGCGNTAACELLVEQLDSSDKWVKLCALAALRKFKIEEPAFLSEVRDLLDEDDPELRKEAALTLGKFKDQESADKLIEVMEGEDPGLRKNAQWAMEQISGKKLGSNVKRWRAWQEKRNELEERKLKRKQAETYAMRKAVRDAAKPKEEPVDRAGLHLSLSFSGLALLILLAASVWVVMPTWLNSKISLAEKRRAKGDGMNIAELARRFKASDHMPDFVVYPFLLSTINAGSPAQREIALRLLELRAFGGCRLLTDKAGARGRGKPTKAARQWISNLPRSLLEDLAVLRGPGRRLVRVLDPDNSRWKRSPTRDETRKAQRSYNSWLGKTA